MQDNFEPESILLSDGFEATSQFVIPPNEEELAPPYSIKTTSFAFSRRNGVLISEQGPEGALVLHRPDATLDALVEMRRLMGVPVSFRQISEDEFEKLLTSTYEHDSDQAMEAMEDLGDEFDLGSVINELQEPEDLLESDDDAPIIRLINALLTQAIKEDASDVHIEPMENRLLVRFRVDGVLREILQPKRVYAPLIASRIKVMAKLDIAEKRLPQDGRISLRLAGRAVDVRVSTIPSAHGERVVLRLLDKQAGRLDLDHLGMASKVKTQFKEVIHRSHGIILVTGPTGSGKTTTLYSVLESLNESSRNILTVEDPIEYYLDGIGQTQVNSKVDMTFARGLRAILRQDPDVVMVGEIRDSETVQIAIQASLTGHLVLSTLHTNTAVGAVTRLRDMEVEPFLLSSSLLGVVAQRLVRQLCSHCREAYEPAESELKLLSLEPGKVNQLYRAKGCPECKGSGYQGRKGIYELVLVDSTLQSMIHDGASEAEMEAHARKSTPGIWQDGALKVARGETTVDELLRVSQSG
ncbi:MAG: type II secretion system ATPase GspE [Candidatus Sedimenticola sp. 6PFRAG7]